MLYKYFKSKKKINFKSRTWGIFPCPKNMEEMPKISANTGQNEKRRAKLPFRSSVKDM